MLNWIKANLRNLVFAVLALGALIGALVYKYKFAGDTPEPATADKGNAIGAASGSASAKPAPTTLPTALPTAAPAAPTSSASAVPAASAAPSATPVAVPPAPTASATPTTVDPPKAADMAGVWNCWRDELGTAGGCRRSQKDCDEHKELVTAAYKTGTTHRNTSCSPLKSGDPLWCFGNVFQGSDSETFCFLDERTCGAMRGAMSSEDKVSACVRR